MYDEENNLHYNFYRDYDPQTGRYVQSDPIGLAGGIDSYTYVGGNPVATFDQLSLAPFKNEQGRPCVCNDLNVYRKDLNMNTETGTDYGHHWLEIGGTESYGYWPSGSVGLWDTLSGVPGSVNRGFPRDPHHGDRRNLSDSFSLRPYVWPRSDATCQEVCERAKECIRNFAASYQSRFGSDWSWRGDQGWAGDNSCHTFQSRALETCNVGR